MKKKLPCMGQYKHDWFTCSAHHDNAKPKFKVPYWFCFRCGYSTDKEPKAVRLRRKAFQADPNCKHSSYRQIENKHGQVSHECANASCRIPVKLVIVPPRPVAPPPEEGALGLKTLARAIRLDQKNLLTKLRCRKLFRKWCKLNKLKPTIQWKKQFMLKVRKG